MTIQTQKNGDSLAIALTGRLDTVTSPELEKVITGSLDGIKALTLELEKLEYISSAGLRVLLQAQKLMNGKGTMKVLHPSEIVREVFDVTGFSDILDIE
ncbi:MAG: STAS domain-containing protein [Clostridia bacterium]|nr:STAS domain-containing protein [Clostridia bacterium]